MAFTHRDMVYTFHKYILCVFSDGLMDCRDAFHAVLCLYFCVTDRLYTVAEYEVYWLMGVPLINP